MRCLRKVSKLRTRLQVDGAEAVNGGLRHIQHALSKDYVGGRGELRNRAVAINVTLHGPTQQTHGTYATRASHTVRSTRGCTHSAYRGRRGWECAQRTHTNFQFLPPLTPTYPQSLNRPVANITAKLGSCPLPPPSTNLSPTLPSFPPPNQYLVLRDTLCSCEVYGMRPMYKEKKIFFISPTLPSFPPPNPILYIGIPCALVKLVE
jgi:hypothetical protein